MPPARIVVADDDPDICELVALKLRRAGHTVWTSEHGTDALGLLRTERPDVAVLDVMMPGLSGLDIVREIRADAGLRDMGLVLLTAKTQDVDVAAGFSAGADDYLAKPFSPRELAQRVTALLQRRALVTP